MKFSVEYRHFTQFFSFLYRNTGILFLSILECGVSAKTCFKKDGKAEKERHTFLHTAQTSDCPHTSSHSELIHFIF